MKYNYWWSAKAEWTTADELAFYKQLSQPLKAMYKKTLLLRDKKKWGQINRLRMLDKLGLV